MDTLATKDLLYLLWWSCYYYCTTILLEQYCLEGYGVSRCKVSAAGSGSPGVQAAKALFTGSLAKLP